MEPNMWNDPWHVMQLLCTTDYKDNSVAQRKRERDEWWSLSLLNEVRSEKKSAALRYNSIPTHLEYISHRHSITLFKEA